MTTPLGKRQMNRIARAAPRSLLRMAGHACSCLVPVAFCVLSGCAWDRWNMLAVKAPPGPADSLVLRGDRLEPETPPVEGTGSGDLAGGHELFRREEYAKAESVFHRVAENTKNSPQVAEEARYFEAECLRLQSKYPRAADTYNRMLNDFPSGAYREQAVQRMFDIANYWLEDTRQEVETYREVQAGKRWLIMPTLFHWDKSKPVFDEEGRALEKLEQVHYNAIADPIAEKALFLAGSVKFYREDYRDADHYFSQLVDHYPNSPLAPQALELGIIAKHMSTGGSDYDGRKVAEARKLVDRALNSYPELANKKRDFLERQLAGINMQQAEKDFKMAEFYRRTGHPPSAYFYYEIVRRRYPGTRFFDLATERMHELRSAVEKEAAKKGQLPIAAKAEPPASGPEQAPAPRTLPPQPETAPAPRPLAPQPETAPAPRPLPPQGQPQAEAAPQPRRWPWPFGGNR